MQELNNQTPTLLISDAITWPLLELPFRIERYSPNVALPKELRQAEALLVWDVGRKWLSESLPQMPNLRWIQALSAGIDHVLDAKPAEHVLVTNGKGLHDAPTAEMAVALLLSAARNMHIHRDNQHQAAWPKESYAQSLNHQGLGTLEGAKILIVGMGAIGLNIAKRLQPFGAIVEGVATNGGVRQGILTHAIGELDEVLKNQDAIVLVLPNTPSTNGLLSAGRIAQLKPHAWVINVGRGSAIDQRALTDVLVAGKIGGAALDVMQTEPLPKESVLWSLPNVILTPHVGGGGPRFYGKASALIQRNAQHFVRGQALENLVSRRNGY